MSRRTSDVVPICETRACLTQLAEEVVNGVAEKVLTKNGVSCDEIIDARKRDHYLALEDEHVSLLLLSEAEIGLRQILTGQRISPAELNVVLND